MGARAGRRVETGVAGKVAKVQEVGVRFGRAVMAALAVAILLKGGLRYQTLAIWAVCVCWILMEVLADFGGAAGDHFLRFGLSLGAGAVGAASEARGPRPVGRRRGGLAHVRPLLKQVGGRPVGAGGGRGAAGAAGAKVQGGGG